MAVKGLISIMGAVVLMSCINNYESSYNRNAEVVYIENNIATFEDTCGYTWEWDIETGDNLFIGKQVILKMDNCHTDTINDDIIKKVVDK